MDVFLLEDGVVAGMFERFRSSDDEDEPDPSDRSVGIIDECEKCGDQDVYGVIIENNGERSWVLENCWKCTDEPEKTEAVFREFIRRDEKLFFVAREIQEGWEVTSPNGRYEHRFTEESQVEAECVGAGVLWIEDGDIQKITIDGITYTPEDPPNPERGAVEEPDVSFRFEPIDEPDVSSLAEMEDVEPYSVRLRSHPSFEDDPESVVSWRPTKCPECGLESPNNILGHETPSGYYLEHRYSPSFGDSCGEIIGFLSDGDQVEDVMEETEEILNQDIDDII